jgi:hypothetical protein
MFWVLQTVSMNMVDSKLNLAKSLNNRLFFGKPVVKVFFSVPEQMVNCYHHEFF